MRPLFSVRVLFAVMTAAVLLSAVSSRLASGADSTNKNRHNLFDPIFGYDDIDAHTVSAGSSQLKPRELKPARQPDQPQLFNEDQSELASARISSGTPAGSNQSPSSNKKATTSFSLSTGTQKPLAKPSFNIPLEPTRTTRRESEQPRHWSALENYYQKLKQSALTNVQQQQLAQANNNYQPIYQVLQQQEADDSLSAYKPLNSYSAPYLSGGLTSLLSNTQQSLGSASAAKTPGFLLQLINSQPPSSDPDFGFSVHHNSAPGISRTGGIGASSILMAPQAIRQSSASSSPSASSSLANYQVKSLQTVAVPPPASMLAIVGAPTTTTTSNLDDGDRLKNLEWRRLPELLLIQQQQQRIKHQQETFGDWYDHQRSRELLQEEAFCGPRNYLANLAGHLEAASSLKPNGYPSHMGVYNGSADADANYLCAATWIHEQFALTLASCLRGTDSKRLVVRAGEWNLNKNSTANERPTFLRQVEQVFIFPKYRSESTEHNLALLKFTKPLDYIETTRLCPACQVQSRSLIRASSCWAPIRNMTVSEYFDADGEGETKEKKSVSMVDVPVKLIANDNSECLRQTKLDYFNFQHPNYICSADFKGALWRARLNQTEYFGSGIYCNEGGNLSLVSILHPIHSNSSSAFGFMDLSYYRPWMRNVISGRTY